MFLLSVMSGALLHCRPPFGVAAVVSLPIASVVYVVVMIGTHEIA
jgi:hypothetical protein